MCTTALHLHECLAVCFRVVQCGHCQRADRQRYGEHYCILGNTGLRGVFACGFGSDLSNGPGGASVTCQMNDRGCEISGFIDIFSATSTYAMSSTNQCNNSEHGRIGIFAGIYSDASSIKIDPASYSLVSRMVNDWNISGPVTIATHPHKSPKLLSFNTTTNGVRCIFFCMGYWRTTPRITSFLNPQITSRLMPLGFRYIYTRKHKMQHRHNALSMKTSLADMFQTLYAGMVIQVAFPQAGSPR